ncbi:hypothetical protein [Brevibacillus laterosporus]|uniref:hypothetical protein n=1 Tax=Brevibacillus laterosporus TaxID=1465 RepID=UPI00215C5BD9|nr:hypothetical protein [Brevibacillus laterosporus]MCR8994698.1 hypothetical protein [Brevibacillus laterosporus]
MSMIKHKSWEEFHKTGLLWFINTTLHMFGWTLMFDTETKIVTPARCKYRGYSEDITSDGYKKVSQYMKDNAEELVAESKL